jgi:uncharacterized membrane protein
MFTPEARPPYDPEVNEPHRVQLGRGRSGALHLSQSKRLMIGAVLGTCVGTATAFATPWQAALLSGWDAAALVIVLSLWVVLPALDGAMTEATASREDMSRANGDLIVLAASVVSLVGVILTLIAVKHTAGALKAIMTSIAVLTVLLSWLTVHTIFTLRYAHLYYTEPNGGVDFPDEDHPDYLDFAYLSFTVGMTFQVSDTDISSRAIRRTITRHALLGYVFGTIIIGVMINIVAGLVQ